MNTSSPERTSWWAAFKEKHQVAPPESFDSWEPRSVPPPVSFDPRDALSILRTLAGVCMYLVSLLFKLVPSKEVQDQVEKEQEERDIEYENFINLHYDDPHSSSKDR